MSNFLAVATVTATLRRLLQGAVAQDVGGAAVTTVRPDNSAGGLPTTGANVFLYHVAPSAHLRNLDLPTRRSDGGVVQPPQAAIELYYLLSFYGDEATLEPQRIYGSITRTLHARPVLTRQMIEDTLVDPTFSFLASSDLASAPERVRLVPVGMTLQEQAQLWTGVFTNTEYVLSVCYRASVVLLTADDTPQPSLPVRDRALLVQPFRQPAIDRIEAVGGPGVGITTGATLRIFGRRLRADLVRVRLGGLEVEPTEVEDGEITLPLALPLVDPTALRAGLTAVQVLHPFLLGVPPQPRSGVESNVGSFLLRPRITSISATKIQPAGGGLVRGDFEINIEPPVDATQRVSLELFGAPLSGGGPSYSFPLPERAATASTLQYTVPGVAEGVYLARVRIDGAESLLEVEDDPASPNFGLYLGPEVELEQ